MKPSTPQSERRTVWSVRLTAHEAATLAASLRLRADIAQADQTYTEETFNQSLYREVAEQLARQLKTQSTQQELL